MGKWRLLATPQPLSITVILSPVWGHAEWYSAMMMLDEIDPKEWEWVCYWAQVASSRSQMIKDIFKNHLDIEETYIFVTIMLARWERNWREKDRRADLRHPRGISAEEAMVRSLIYRECKREPNMAANIRLLSMLERRDLAWMLADVEWGKRSKADVLDDLDEYYPLFPGSDPIRG